MPVRPSVWQPKLLVPPGWAIAAALARAIKMVAMNFMVRFRV